MSNDFYFNQWKAVLHRLQSLANSDQQNQDANIHCKDRCEAVARLNGMLGAYIRVYNDALECRQQNLQVQKTQDYEAVVKAIVSRIVELKLQLRKLEGYQLQFLSQGVVQHHLTTDDAELQDIPCKVEREDFVEAMISEAINKAKEAIEAKELELLKQEQENNEDLEKEQKINWWDDDVEEVKEPEFTGNKFAQYEVVKVESAETLERRRVLALIQAQERTRQVIRWKISKEQRRELWVKQLEGKLQPPARLELRIRAVKLMQRTFRIFMELKRKKIQDCQKDKILGISPCGKISCEARFRAKEIKEHRQALFKKFDREWKSQCAEIKQNYLKRKHDSIKEDYRDKIRDWFQTWYTKIKLFHDIPPDNKGGSAQIFREELPSPEEWLEQYEAYLEEQKKNKNKSTLQLKSEKMEGKREAMRAKKEELLKKKRDEQLLQKIMKNPNMHPGYQYPKSKKTQDIITVLDNYHASWDDLDAEGTVEVKKKNIKELDIENLYMEVKLEIIREADGEMRKELKKLKTALKKDYQNAGETMPEGMKKKSYGRKKKKKRVKVVVSELVAERMEQLAEKGILKEYPLTKLEDFVGDHNFAGDRIRCNNNPAVAFPGEIRSVWWEHCRALAQGLRRLLLVGPSGGGKTMLVHAMATMNNAVLFELDPQQFDDEFLSPLHLQHVVNTVASCARAAQPAVIYVKHAHRLFLRKAPASDALLNPELIRQHLIGKLIKKIQKTDKITFIGSCTDPWLTKTSKLLKQFPEVVLLPDTSYSVVIQLLSTWMNENRCFPRNLNIHCLAHMLQGYSFPFIKDVLNHFLEPASVVNMALHGLSAEEMLDYVLQCGTEKTDYDKYLKWYADRTSWGRKEKKQLQESREFQALSEKYAAKEREKKKKSAPPSEKTN